MEFASSVSALKAMIVTLILLVFMFLCISATNLTVGDSSGWSLFSNITKWSASTSFFVNDSLVFLYTPDHDVIEVHEADFTTCRINSPIATHNDGETVILLSQPGTRYFVCGRSYHCAKGLKLSVTTMDLKAPPSPKSQPSVTGSNTTTSPAQNNTSKGPPSSNGCNSLDFIAFESTLMHLGISFMALLKHLV